MLCRLCSILSNFFRLKRAIVCTIGVNVFDLLVKNVYSFLFIRLSCKFVLSDSLAFIMALTKGKNTD